ncbi:MAG: thioredoxin domain-containing protein [Candidatus Krumholzibacteriia bacterium]
MTASAGSADDQRGPQAHRDPQTIRREGNRLRDEASLYLKQHAHNPVEWYPWGEEALEKARREDRPIFLSIGYSSCHWCHVMEQEVFEDDETAEFLNRHFVAIKVDREERPDIDSIYMHAVQIITGRGGWPLSAFLTPDQKPFFGGTYFPQRPFLDLLGKIVGVFREQREELERQGAQLAERVLALPTPAPGAAPARVDAAMIDSVAQHAELNFDRRYGGFQGQQKFPTPCRWQFLLRHHRKTGENRYAVMVGKTLEAMASGGIYDHVGGGFHRYTVDSKWIVPHFEKMLYDNAQLASLYLEAGVVLERPDFLAVARDVLDFLLGEMRSPDGGFHSSFDADAGGDEGAYHVWTPDDLTIATNPDDGPLLAELLGVAPVGNFGGPRNVLTRRADAAQAARDFERDPEEVAGLFAKHRHNLRAYRDRRPAPARDPKIITSWNALTITALAHGSMVFGSEPFLEAARAAAEFIWTKHRRDDGRLMRASSEGRLVGSGILDDHAYLAAALLDLFQCDGDPGHLERAIELVEIVRRDFAAPDGGFYMTAQDARTPIGRSIDLFDSVMPSGNAVMLQNMVRLAALTGRGELRQEAQRHLDAFAPLLGHTQLEMAVWFDVAQKLVGPFYDVVVAGDPRAEDTRALVAAVHRRLPSHVVLAPVPATGADPDLAGLAPAVAQKPARDGRATAYVCRFGSCEEPTSEPDRLVEQLTEGWSR